MSLETIAFQSTILETTVRLNVCVPDADDGPCPAVYCYHGLGDTCETFAARSGIKELSDRLGLVAVMPDAGRSWHVNDTRPGGAAWEDYLAGELVDYVDEHFPVRPDRKGRGLAGFSMGGYGALLYAFRHPERFGAVASLAASVSFGHALRPDRPERSAFMMAVAPPGGDCDLWVLAERLSDGEERPAIRMEVGDSDHLLEHNRRFHARLEEVEIAHEYEEVPGSHGWEYVDRRLPVALAFLAGTLGAGDNVQA